MVDAVRFGIRVRPDDLFIGGDFDQFDSFLTRSITGDDGIAIRQTLRSTGVFDRFAGQVGVRQLPNCPARSIHFEARVAVSTIDQRVPIGQADRRKWPMRCFNLPDNLSFSRIFTHDFIE